MAILASVLAVASLVSAVAGISCYDNSAATASIGSSSVSGAGYGYAGSSATSTGTRQILNNCQSCQKTIIMYNMATYKYNDVKYECATQSLASNSCTGSASVVAYTDGTVYTRSCVCCTNSCNTESYCTQNDYSMTNSLSMGGGSIGRCNGGNARTSSMALMSTVFLGAAALLF